MWNDLIGIINSFYPFLMTFLPKVMLAIVILIVGFWGIQRISKSASSALKKSGGDATVNRFLASLISIGLKVMLLLSVASIFGVQTTSFIAIFSALAFSVGTALSGNIGHFASGIMILSFRPYRVGDEITVQSHTGIVTHIQVFHTTILTTENRKIIIPNGIITSGVIVNSSAQGKIRINVPISVADETDFEKAKALILAVAEDCPMCLKEPACKVLVTGFNKNGLEILVRPWCLPSDINNIGYYFQEHIRATFLENGIEPPVNQIDVLTRTKVA
jgi:small conductance mechanosensitive channel